MYCKIPYGVKQFAWNGPFIVVERTLSARADVQAHSCVHCWDSVGTCVCMSCLCVRKNAWRSLPAPLGRGQNREWRQTHTRMVERGYCTPCHASVKKTVAGCWFCSHSFYILWGGGLKKRMFSVPFFLFPPVSITGRRPKQSNYKLNTHLSLAALHNSVGEAGWKDFLFVCFFVSLRTLYFISLSFHLLAPIIFFPPRFHHPLKNAGFRRQAASHLQQPRGPAEASRLLSVSDARVWSVDMDEMSLTDEDGGRLSLLFTAAPVLRKRTPTWLNPKPQKVSPRSKVKGAYLVGTQIILYSGKAQQKMGHTNFRQWIILNILPGNSVPHQSALKSYSSYSVCHPTSF